MAPQTRGQGPATIRAARGLGVEAAATKLPWRRRSSTTVRATIPPSTAAWIANAGPSPKFCISETAGDEGRENYQGM